MNSPQVYAEVYEILNVLGKDYINKLPKKFYKYIEEARDKNSIVEFDINKNPLEQDISEDASYIVTYLNLEYWCTQEEKEKLINEYIKNDEIFYNKMREKYNPDEIFKKNVLLEDENNQNILPTNIKSKDNILKKLIKKIFNILKMNKKI